MPQSRPCVGGRTSRSNGERWMRQTLFDIQHSSVTGPLPGPAFPVFVWGPPGHERGTLQRGLFRYVEGPGARPLKFMGIICAGCADVPYDPSWYSGLMTGSQKGPDGLIERVRVGDTSALASAFEVQRERLRRIVAFRMDARLAGRVDPDDVLQEAYLNASKRCTHVEGDTDDSLFVWLRLITVQTLADVYRRHIGAQMRDAGREAARGHHESGTTSVSLAAGLLGHLTSPTRALRRVERVEQLVAALDQLSETDREVIALRHFEELTNQEVAAILGIEQKAASIRYVRALRRLKDVLVDFPGGLSLSIAGC